MEIEALGVLNTWNTCLYYWYSSMYVCMYVSLFTNRSLIKTKAHRSNDYHKIDFDFILVSKYTTLACHNTIQCGVTGGDGVYTMTLEHILFLLKQ